MAAILGLDSDLIMNYFDMAHPERASNPNETTLEELVGVINAYMAFKISKMPRLFQGHSVIDYGDEKTHKPLSIDYFKFGEKALDYLKNGYSIICGLTLDGDTGQLMNTTVGNKFSQNGRRFTGHWIDITGISSDWGDQSEFIGDYQGRDAISPWKW